VFQPPKSLVDAVRQQTLVPFIGAGVSVGAVHGLAPDKQFPDWQGLILRLAARLELEQKAAEAAQVQAALPDTMAAAQLAVDSLGRPLFLDEMTKAFGRPRAPVGANLSAAHAIWRLRSPFLITTNYDLALEWPWDPTQIQRIHNDDPSYLAAIEQQHPLHRIWYVHGSIGRVDTLILTSNQYTKLYPENDPKRVEYQNAFNQLQYLLTTRSFLFLGFSLTEPVLRRKLQDILEITAHAAPIKFLLLRAGEADAAKKKDFLDTYNVQVVEFETFGAPMIAAIDTIGREAWRDAPAASGAGLTAEMQPLVDDLLTRVAGLSLPPAVVARIYNAVKPAAWTHAVTGGDGVTLLHDAIMLLGRAISRAEDGVPPLLDFANRLKSEVGEPWLSRLQLWLDGAVARLGADAAARDLLTERLAAGRPAAAPERVHVLVRIQTLTTASGQWLVHAWSWSGLRVPESLFGAEGRRFKAGASEEVVYDLVDELEARSVDPDLTSIAFVVPSALACEAIHGWRLAESVAKDPPLGVSYTVTVRSLERLERAPLLRRRFKRAWDDVKKRAAQILTVLDPNAPAPAAGVPAVVLDRAAAMKQDLGTSLEKQGVRCVVLREAPSPAGLGHLSAVLDTTVPAILWHRDAGVASADVDRAMRTLLQSGPIADLPRRVRDERSAAFGDQTGAHYGMNLTLIWDDTDYMPPEQDPNARATLETI
jgi:vWA-MoxR associated protein C-terminal domain/SIR2-like domain